MCCSTHCVLVLKRILDIAALVYNRAYDPKGARELLELVFL